MTRLSKLTSAEFSPRKLCGVFLMAPLLACTGSAASSKLNSNRSAPLLLLCPEVPLVLGEVVLFLLDIISNSSVSVSGDWLAGDHRCAGLVGAASGGADVRGGTVGACHGSCRGVGAQGSWSGGGDAAAKGCHGSFLTGNWKKKQLNFSKFSKI